MRRREFFTLLGGAAAIWRISLLFFWPRVAWAQGQALSKPAADGQIGQVATVQGSASVTRGSAAAAIALRVKDPIFKNDALQTGANSALGVTFDDETTFSLSANSALVVNDFVYQEGGSGNAGLFTASRGTVAFVASLLAKSGDMKIATPVAQLGIRGTTGVIDVPQGGAAGAPAGGENRIKLYPDPDGHVGQIVALNPQGNRVGILTQGATALTLRTDANGQLEAVPFQIPPAEVARDRGLLRRLFAAHAIGRRMTRERKRARSIRQRPQQRNRPPGGRERPRGRPQRPFERR